MNINTIVILLSIKTQSHFQKFPRFFKIIFEVVLKFMCAFHFSLFSTISFGEFSESTGTPGGFAKSSQVVTAIISMKRRFHVWHELHICGKFLLVWALLQFQVNLVPQTKQTNPSAKTTLQEWKTTPSKLCNSFRTKHQTP